MTLPTTFTPGSSGIAEAFNQTNTAVNRLLGTPIPGPAGETGVQGVTGPVGPQGPQGASGGFAQANFATPKDEWIFNHNLGYPPAVMTYDTNGVVIQGQVSENTAFRTVVDWYHPIAGSMSVS